MSTGPSLSARPIQPPHRSIVTSIGRPFVADRYRTPTGCQPPRHSTRVVDYSTCAVADSLRPNLSFVAGLFPHASDDPRNRRARPGPADEAYARKTGPSRRSRGRRICATANNLGAIAFRGWNQDRRRGAYGDRSRSDCPDSFPSSVPFRRRTIPTHRKPSSATPSPHHNGRTARRLTVVPSSAQTEV